MIVSQRLRKGTLIEYDHLGDWSPEKDCCWGPTFQQPGEKPSSESSDSEDGVRTGLIIVETSDATNNPTQGCNHLDDHFKSMYMLWFKFILGVKFFELVSILFAIVPDYGN